MKPKNQEEIDRDKKYAAFRKTDAFHAESILYRLILYMMTPFIPIRFVFGTSVAVWCCVSAKFVLLLGGSTPETLNSVQTWLIYGINKVAGFLLLQCFSIMWTFKSRPKVCYKKYLGPDWKPDYGLSGCLIGNHQSFTDMLVGM